MVGRLPKHGSVPALEAGDSSTNTDVDATQVAVREQVQTRPRFPTGLESHGWLSLLQVD
jgi:hypothetical protein